MNNMKVFIDNKEYNITNTIKFSGGELHVNVNHLPEKCEFLLLECRLSSSDDIMEMMLLAEALSHKYSGAELHAYIPYMPYARQDRRCAKGDAHSLNVFSMMCINTLHKLEYRVATLDIHSNEGARVIESYGVDLSVMSQAVLVALHRELLDIFYDGSYPVIVAPDLGASQKSQELADAYNLDFAQGGKVRDPNTGKLTGFTIDREDFKGEDVLIVDDICDGGGTFLGLISLLKERNVGKVMLYVTHGIFSAGFDCFSGMVDTIYTTDSFNRKHKPEVLNGEVAPGVNIRTIHI